MDKIIFEFSEIDHDDITITIDATQAEVIFAATILIDRLATNMREGTKVSKEKAIEDVLKAIQKLMCDTLKKMGDIK